MSRDGAGRVYLDWNATAPLRPEARAAMLEAMGCVGNPSSVHAEGRAARALVDRARAQVAPLIGCSPEEIVFTSGATEAAAAILANRVAGQDVLVQDTAHDCLWSHLSLGNQAERPEGPGHTLAMGLANSETGVITWPERDGRGWIYGPRARAGWLFVDAVQAAGRMALDLPALGADFAAVSAHKIGGPKGVGALMVRDGVDIAPMLTGGGQERGRRAGTENLIGIAGFGAAAEAAMADLAAGLWERVAEIRNILERTLADAVEETIFFGQECARLPNTSCFAVPGWKGETQVMQMDLAGFAISAGSACSSGKVGRNRVLRAMGQVPEIAESAIRVSLGPSTTEGETAAFARAWTDHHRRRKARAA